MIQPTEAEWRLVADLPNHGGYPILLAYLEGKLAALLTELANASTDENERRLMNEWRATRSLVEIMRELPAYGKHQSELLQQQVGPQLSLYNSPGLQLTPSQNQAINTQLQPRSQLRPVG